MEVTYEATKCKSMILSRKCIPSSIDLYFGDSQLAVHDKLEILGVIFDNKLLRSNTYQPLPPEMDGTLVP